MKANNANRSSLWINLDDSRGTLSTARRNIGRRKLALASSLTSVLLMTTGAAYAHSHPESGTSTYSSTCIGVDTNVEYSIDGNFADGGFGQCSGTTIVKGTNAGKGAFQSFGVSEVSLTDPIETCTLPDGTSGITFDCIEPDGGVSLDSAGEALFGAGSSGTECIELTSGPPYEFASQETGDFIGGTGKWANASGSFTNNVTGFLVNGPGVTNSSAYGGISYFVTKSTGTIVTP
jgi:hypothetical protein